MSPRIIHDDPPAEPPPEIVRVEVKPGTVRRVPLPAGMTAGRVVQYEAVLEPVPGQPGLWREVRLKHSPLVKLTDDLEQEQGWGLTRRDLLALAYGGFVPAYRPGLQTTLIDAAAVWQHIRRTSLQGRERAAAFWTRENVRRFSEGSQEAVSRGLISRDLHREATEKDAGQSFLDL